MASEPFFEERIDAVKMSETPYPTNGSGKNPAKDTGIKYSDLCTHPCPYRLAGLGTSLRVWGKLTTKEERIYSFYFFIYAFNDILCRILRSHSYFVYIFQFFTHACHRSRMTAGVNYIFKEFFTVVSKRKNRKRKPSPNDGKIRKACKSQAVPACRGRWRRQPSEGASWSRHGRKFLTEQY